jgi:hypothetical protein
MIDEIHWTVHGARRRRRRRVDEVEVEGAIRQGHEFREANVGRADWRLRWDREDGIRVTVLYDFPMRGSEAAASVVSVQKKRIPQRF